MPGGSVPYLRFQLGGHFFAVAGALVREVARAVAISPLPKAPPVIEGVINVRGVLVPVLDIRHRFGLRPNPLAPEQHLVVAQAGDRVVALRVDRALEMIPVAEGDIESAAHVAPGAEYVAGIARLADGLLVIHDLGRFLSLEEAGRVDDALAQAAPAGKPRASRKGGR